MNVSLSTEEKSDIDVTQTKEFLGTSIRYGEAEAPGGRTVIWFVLNDVLKALDINSTALASRLKQQYPDALSIRRVIDSRGHRRNTNIVKEDLVYTHIIPRSRKPNAKEFARWVGAVIREIRNTGTYSVNDRQLNAEMKRLCITERKNEMDFVQFAYGVFGDDDRMSFLIREKAASLLGQAQPGAQLAIEQPAPPLTVSELMEGLGLPKPYVLKNRIRVGRYVANAWRQTHNTEPPTTLKYVNGHSVNVKCYPHANRDEVNTWIQEWMC